MERRKRRVHVRSARPAADERVVSGLDLGARRLSSVGRERRPRREDDDERLVYAFDERRVSRNVARRFWRQFDDHVDPELSDVRLLRVRPRRRVRISLSNRLRRMDDARLRSGLARLRAQHGRKRAESILARLLCYPHALFRDVKRLGRDRDARARLRRDLRRLRRRVELEQR